MHPEQDKQGETEGGPPACQSQQNALSMCLAKHNDQEAYDSFRQCMQAHQGRDQQNACQEPLDKFLQAGQTRIQRYGYYADRVLAVQAERDVQVKDLCQDLLDTMNSTQCQGTDSMECMETTNELVTCVAAVECPLETQHHMVKCWKGRHVKDFQTCAQGGLGFTPCWNAMQRHFPPTVLEQWERRSEGKAQTQQAMADLWKIAEDMDTAAVAQTKAGTNTNPSNANANA